MMFLASFSLLAGLVYLAYTEYMKEQAVFFHCACQLQMNYCQGKFEIGLKGNVLVQRKRKRKRKSYASGSHLKRHIKEEPAPTATRA
eukprot:1143592-Pelagomonas_calceolata.AAC.2